MASSPADEQPSDTDELPTVPPAESPADPADPADPAGSNNEANEQNNLVEICREQDGNNTEASETTTTTRKTTTKAECPASEWVLRPPRGPKAAHAAFVGRAKIHGVRHFLWPRHAVTRRILWLLAFMAALGLLLAWSADRIQHLLSRPAHTRVSTSWVRGLPFPAVTFCNNNPVRFPRLTKSDLYVAGMWLGLLTHAESQQPQATFAATAANLTANPHMMAGLSEPRRQWFQRMSDFSRFLPPREAPGISQGLLDRLGHSLDEMVLSCRFCGQDCKPQDFITVYTRYGKCYTFNSGKGGRPLLTTVKGGMGNGLEIMLDIQQEEYLPVWGENDETSFEAGIKVQIHSQDEPPLIDQLGFGVSPGFQTFVSCQEQRLIYLPPPWGDCKSTPISSDFFETYSITACRIDCETRYLVENCNCRMVHMPGDAPYCTPEQYTECARPVLDVLVKRDNDFCLCETPCNMTRYGKELSMVKIPSKASAKYLAKKYNKTEAYIAENVLVLDIFFEALNYETIEQKKAYEVAGLLGDIGGQMGLFIGASILTILEIFDYVYELIRDKILFYFRAKKKQKTESKDTSLPMTGPCEALRGHSESAGYAASMLPPPHHHHQHHALHHHAGGRPGYEDFTC
ncbi:acid-sensing ion channel 1-like isoform X1 [Petromyzon marinus]|uniref:acid-sensing ion channel 1-like isoform X1 n=1 Tax=Petromyzon marinus TaxID=7757 RepID=UPI003F710E4D